MRDKETNIFNVAKHYLTILKVPFTNSYLKKLILHDPYFPQLTALSNVFKKYKIETKAYQVPEDKFSLLTPPYVAYVDDQPAGKDLILVTASDGTNVTYISSTSTPVIVSKDGLLESWEGVVIVATSTAGSKEPAYDKHLGEESSRTISRTLAIAGIALLIVAGVYGYVSSVATDYLPKSLLILLFKSMGLAVAILLFIYQLDTNNSFIKKSVHLERKPVVTLFFKEKLQRFSV
jgi:ABC-type bacteriocin/lantibiotic exporter with double-glycine peptidase domain